MPVLVAGAQLNEAAVCRPVAHTGGVAPAITLSTGPMRWTSRAQRKQVVPRRGLARRANDASATMHRTFECAAGRPNLDRCAIVGRCELDLHGNGIAGDDERAREG